MYTVKFLCWSVYSYTVKSLFTISKGQTHTMIKKEKTLKNIIYTDCGRFHQSVAESLMKKLKKEKDEVITIVPVDAPARTEVYAYKKSYCFSLDAPTWVKSVFTPKENDLSVEISCDPPESSYSKPVAIYHAMPHSMMDMERTPAVPDFVVNVDSVMETRKAMLSKHASQREWLDATQGMSSYIDMMVNNALDIGENFGASQYAEGWIRHNYTGYGTLGFDPVMELLSDNVTSL